MQLDSANQAEVISDQNWTIAGITSEIGGLSNEVKRLKSDLSKAQNEFNVIQEQLNLMIDSVTMLKEEFQPYVKSFLKYRNSLEYPSEDKTIPLSFNDLMKFEQDYIARNILEKRGFLDMPHNNDDDFYKLSFQLSDDEKEASCWAYCYRKDAAENTFVLSFDLNTEAGRLLFYSLKQSIYTSCTACDADGVVFNCPHSRYKYKLHIREDKQDGTGTIFNDYGCN